MTKSKFQIKYKIQNPKLISTDSRTIKKGEIFLAIKGKKFDGHDFVEKAFEKGARAAIVSGSRGLKAGYKIVKVKNTVKALEDIAKAHRLKFNIPVVAVTGSTGKTTAKEMIAHVLSAKYNVLKSERSNNSFVGLPLALVKLDRKHDACVLEMGMNHAGEIDKLCKIARPDIGVIANIGPAHLGFLGTVQNIFTAKSELLNNLPEDGVAILNNDDVYLKRLNRLKCKKVYFGIDRKGDFRAENPEYGKNGWRFSIGKERFELRLLGKHNIYNALIAIAVARQFNMGYRLISKMINSFRQGCPMRLEFKSVRGVGILDDSYNSNPSSMKRAIEALTDYDTDGKRIIVSGDMLELGRRAKTLHEALGRTIAKSPVGVLITLGKLSRFTSEAARQKGMRTLYHAASYGDAAGFLRKVTKAGDVVLVKGSREMEMEKVIEKFR
ncbi:MAG: UDP-N-acetylmuramoyl-tripeptide--D-alanyl-D-alanine ligase [Candidatus Omnitrophota bacterium]